MFAKLFKTAMQIADMRHCIDDAFTIERQNDAQRRVRRRMLRTEVERPQVLALVSVGWQRVGEREGHSEGLNSELTFGARNHRKIMPLTAAAQRIIFAKRERREFFGHQYPAQVRMAREV